MSEKREREEQKFHYQYIATPHLVNEDVLGALLKNGNVNEEFICIRRKLRVIVPESVFGKIHIELLRLYLSKNARSMSSLPEYCKTSIR